jgi:hypothetical protein
MGDARYLHSAGQVTGALGVLVRVPERSELVILNKPALHVRKVRLIKKKGDVNPQD